ncbi:MAG: hypothetical protein J6Y20_04305, partial [Lachnospiraceae bacterium]|nr:hypothetical protein [Lachnospiraceae bacterium]
LEPGEYYIDVTSHASGWRVNETQPVKITVLEAPDVVFNLNIEDDGQGVYELPVKKDLLVSVYVPDTDYVQCELDGQCVQMDCNGQLFSLGSWQDDGSEHTITIYKYTETGEMTECGSKTFRVVVYGELQVGDTDVPEVIGENEKFTFTIPLPDYANDLQIDIDFFEADIAECYYIGYWECQDRLQWTDDGVVVTIPADDVVKNRIILISCRVYGEIGYPDTEIEYMIPVMPAGNSSAATLTLESGYENNRILVREDARCVIGTINEEQIQDVSLVAKKGVNNQVARQYGSDTVVISFEDEYLGGQGQMCAMVRFEGSDDYVPTNLIDFEVFSYGSVGEFGFVGDQTEITVRQGEFVTFEFTEAEHVQDYFVDVFDEYGSWYDAFKFTNGNEVTVSTLNLPVGSYTVIGSANGETGYEGAWAYNDRVLTVTEPADPVSIAVNTLNPETLEEILISWFIEGAVEVGIQRDDNDEIRGWNGDSGYSIESWNESGEYSLTLYVKYNYEDDWTFYDRVTVTVHANNGSLELNTDGVPEQIVAGSDPAVISIPRNDNAAYLGYEYRVINQDGWVIDDDWNDNVEEGGVVISISPEYLVAGYYVEVRVWTGARNYEGAEWHANIPVVPETICSGAELALKDGENAQVLVNLDAGLVVEGVSYPNVRDVLLWAGKHEGYRHCRYDDGGNRILLDYWYDNDCVGEENTVFALILLDGNDEYVMTNSLDLSVGSLGKTGAFDFGVTGAGAELTVTRGEFVYYSFTVSDGATQYWVDAFDEYWSSRNPRNEGTGTSVMLSTAELPAGQYKIYGRAGSPGWEWTESDSYEILNVEEPTDYEIRIAVTKNDILTMEQLFVTVIAPGAYDVGLAIDDKENIWRRSGGPGATFDYNWNEAGVYTLYPCALYSEDGEWVFGEGVGITVSACGQLEIDTSDVPAMITENSETVMITIPWSEEYEYLGYEISCRDLNGDPGEFTLRYDNTEGNPAGIGIPQVWYVAGNTIELGIWAGGIGYEHTHVQISIPVVPASAGDPEVSLSFADGLTGEGILVNKNFSFIISVPDGKEIDDVRLCARGYYERYGYFEKENSDYWFGYRYDNEDAGKKYNLFALVKFTDSDDYVMTNTIPIVVAWFGKTGDYDFEDYETVVTATRGDLVSFTFTPSADATQYWVDAFEEHGGSRNPQSSCDGTTVTMSTADLAAGTYTVYGRAGNGDGWVWTESLHGVTLNVTEPATDDAIIRAGRTVLQTYEDTFVSVYAPNAEKIGFVTDDRYEDMAEWGIDVFWGSSVALYRNWDESGKHTVEVYVIYAGSDEWTKVGEETFTVTAPNGNLSIDTSNVPTQTTAGTDCEIIIPWQNEYDHLGYEVNVVDISVDGGRWTYTSRVENTEGNNADIKIPAKYLKAGCTIELGVWAGSVGYEKADYYVEIPVISEESEVSLSVKEGLINDKAYVNSDIRFVITSEDGRAIEEVRLWFDRWDIWFDGLQNEGSYEFNYHVPNEFDGKTYSVYAAVRFADSDDFVTTNVIDIDVEKIGVTGAFDFANTEEVTVSRGEFVDFTFTPSENATYYWIDAFDKYDCWYNLKSTPNGTTVTVSTSSLPVGQYKLYGRAGGEQGWQWTESQSYVILNVTEATGSDIQLKISKDDVLTMENVMVDVFAAGALEVKVEENGIDRFWEGGESLSVNLNWNNPGQYELIAYANYGTGWVEGDHITVTVSAENGYVELDTSEVPEFLMEDDTDVRFEIPWVEGLDYLGYELRWRDNYGNSFIYDRCENTRDNTESRNAVFQIPKEYLVAGYTFDLNVWTCALGYLPTDYQFTIPVIAQGSGELVFEIEEATPYLRNVGYTAHISITGATYVQLYDGRGFFDVYSYEGEDEIPDEFYPGVRFSDVGTYTLYAVAWVDGEKLTSEPITVTVTTNGETAPTTEVIVPESILSGTDAVIRIEVPDGDFWYHVSVRDHMTNMSILEYQYGEIVGEDFDYSVTYGDDFTTITVGAEMLSADTTYDVEVLYDAEGGCTMTSVMKTLRVIEPKVTITTPKKSGVYGDTFEFAITAPLATSVELYKGDTKLDSFTWVADVFAPEITFTAVAYFEGLEESRTSTITIEVASLGPAPEPTLEVAESVIEGDVLNISVTAEEDVWYSLKVMQGEVVVLEGAPGDAQPFSLAADMPENGDYAVMLSYGKAGYNSAEITMTVEIIPAYTVTWLDGDGNTLKSEQVAAGETPVYTGDTPTKTADGMYTYTFADAWTPEITEVTAAATYTACFSQTPVEHTITFVSTDGTTFATITQDYGTVITPPTNEPVRVGYIFRGWDVEIPTTMPDHDVTITAVWEDTVTFEPTLNMADYTGVNVYIHIPEGEDPAQYTVETKPNNSGNVTVGNKNLKLSTLKSSNRTRGTEKVKFYGVMDVMRLASGEMTDTLVVTLKKNGVTVHEETFTVASIVEERLASGELDEVR